MEKRGVLWVFWKVMAIEEEDEEDMDMSEWSIELWLMSMLAVVVGEGSV